MSHFSLNQLPGLPTFYTPPLPFSLKIKQSAQEDITRKGLKLCRGEQGQGNHFSQFYLLCTDQILKLQDIE